MISLRGLLKRKFPSAKSETLGLDLESLVKKFVNGITIQAKRDEHQENFGLIKACIGTVNIDFRFSTINKFIHCHSPYSS